MNKLILLMIIFYSEKFSQNEIISKTEKLLTGNGQKTWIYLKTESTMGNNKGISNYCLASNLTFKFTNKTYSGNVCQERNAVNSIWQIKGDNDDELYLILDKKYMIDIYKKNINGKEVEILRLKKISDRKDIPTEAHLYQSTK